MSIERTGVRKASDGRRAGKSECLESRQQWMATDLALI